MPKTFHDLVAFQRALDLMVAVYDATACFPRSELFGLTSQLRRAACGVVSQIAEGQGRITYGEWRQLLSQARGSLYEVEAQCLASERLAFLSPAAYAHLKIHLEVTGKTLSGLIRWVRKHEKVSGNRQQATGNQEPATKARICIPPGAQ